jgi:hypothetical protein
MSLLQWRQAGSHPAGGRGSLAGCLLGGPGTLLLAHMPYHNILLQQWRKQTPLPLLVPVYTLARNLRTAMEHDAVISQVHGDFRFIASRSSRTHTMTHVRKHRQICEQSFCQICVRIHSHFYNKFLNDRTYFTSYFHI